MDCYTLKDKQIKKGKNSVYPVFLHKPSHDLMIRDGKFYAVWNKKTGLWSTSRSDVVELIDEEVADAVAKMNAESTDIHYVQAKMLTNDCGTYDSFIKWTKEEDDNFEKLNQKVIFANTKTKKTDYCTFKLPYDICEGPMEAYEEMLSSLYEPEERQKIEWAVGAVISGDAKDIQKAIALYGAPGTGKSTVLDIITKMFKGDKTNTYVTTISTKALGDSNNQFGTGPLKKYKLILIDNDANLSKANENTILNQLIANDAMEANQKYGKIADVDRTGMLFLATNKYINMSDAKSGLRRRMIIVKPRGETIEYNRYIKLKRQINNELGAIAYHCLKVYESMGPDAYNDYVPLDMFELSNPIYNWLYDTWDFELSKDYPNGLSLEEAWMRFRKYCDDSGFNCGKKTEFKADMYEYFEVKQNVNVNGRRHRYFFSNIKPGMFDKTKKYKPNEVDKNSWLDLKVQHSLLDDYLADSHAQYSNENGVPGCSWIDNVIRLKDIDTTKEHYVFPNDHKMIVIDFDTEGATPEDTLIVNKALAKEWPETYCEASRSRTKLHLHYIYDGDVNEIKSGYIKDLEKDGYKVEIKVFPKDKLSSLRRKLSLCNDIPIAHLDVGYLELKEKKDKVFDIDHLMNEKELRAFIHACLNKKHHGATKPEVDYIKAKTDELYEVGIPYDIRDMFPAIRTFAEESTNKKDICLKTIAKIHFCSKDCEEMDFVAADSPEYEEAPIAFFDVEVFPNLFILNWKLLGKEHPVNRMINPDPMDVYKMFCMNKYRWIGFNNRRYDNHIVKAWANGDRTNYDLYKLSQRIIVHKDQNAFLMDAWNISYTDIYDYSKDKMSLKKWEIKLGIHHQELGLPWDKPVPEELWEKVAEYCDNDVIATEAVWNATQGDFLARQALADLAKIAGSKKATVNTSTNKLSEEFIFEGNKNPQSQFNYRFMGAPEEGHTYTVEDDGITAWQDDGKPIFLGYKFKNGKSSYLDVDEIGEGGYVFAEVGNNKNPKHADQAGGMYENVVTFDVASMHPSSVIAENLFGDYYTKRFKEILELRLAIKHKEFNKAKKMFGGKLAKYFENEELADALAGALKIVINAVYGLTSASFENAFKDNRNVDNIVAKRGSLFMINLRNLVQKMGYTVAHCKTDSIKVVNPDKKIFDFIINYGKKFGYNFEIEHKFEKICLVNNAVYIAKLTEDDPDWIKACKKAKDKGLPEPTRWTATGTQFQVPYVFKPLFSHEELIFEDYGITNSVQAGDIYMDYGTESDEDLRFVGKVGLFCPVKEGTGGAQLFRINGDVKAAVTGTKGYLWKEAETIKEAGIEDTIDYAYYDKFVKDAITSISEYGDFEWFAS